MDSHLGKALTLWTVRIAVACYVGRVLLDVSASRHSNNSFAAVKAARWLWTIGCSLYLVHVLTAFACFHAWSHDAAYRHTAEQTAAVIGLNWGGGLYANYAFTLLWVADVIAWWIGGVAFPYRSRAYYWMIHGVFAFMVVNATVVFGPPYWKWAAVAVAMALFAVIRSARRRGEGLMQNDGQQNDEDG